MRVVVANCSATYAGRGDTKLGRAVRAIIIKADGSVSIHNDAGNKPLNYMKQAEFSETMLPSGELVWVFDARQESLSIVITEILADNETELVREDEGLIRDGTEAHLQAWIADNPSCLGEGFTLIQREFPTGNGPVDLLVRDAEGLPVAVEVKRVAMLGAVYQSKRYVDAIKSEYGAGVGEKDELPAAVLDAGFTPDEWRLTRGIIAAIDVRPKTSALAEKRNIQTVTVPKPKSWASDDAEG